MGSNDTFVSLSLGQASESRGKAGSAFGLVLGQYKNCLVYLGKQVNGIKRHVCDLVLDRSRIENNFLAKRVIEADF
jgi:hypothetical protein